MSVGHSSLFLLLPHFGPQPAHEEACVESVLLLKCLEFLKHRLRVFMLPVLPASRRRIEAAGDCVRIASLEVTHQVEPLGEARLSLAAAAGFGQRLMSFEPLACLRGDRFFLVVRNMRRCGWRSSSVRHTGQRRIKAESSESFVCALAKPLSLGGPLRKLRDAGT